MNLRNKKNVLIALSFMILQFGFPFIPNLSLVLSKSADFFFFFILPGLFAVIFSVISLIKNEDSGGIGIIILEIFVTFVALMALGDMLIFY